MRCCGTLEFLCDFHEQCHLTQRLLQEKAVENNIEVMTRLTEQEFNTKFNNGNLEKTPLKDKLPRRKNSTSVDDPISQNGCLKNSSITIQSSRIETDFKNIDDDEQNYDKLNGQENLDVDKEPTTRKKILRRSERVSKSADMDPVKGQNSTEKQKNSFHTKNCSKIDDLQMRNNNSKNNSNDNKTNKNSSNNNKNNENHNKNNNNDSKTDKNKKNRFKNNKNDSKNNENNNNNINNNNNKSVNSAKMDESLNNESKSLQKHPKNQRKHNSNEKTTKNTNHNEKNQQSNSLTRFSKNKDDHNDENIALNSASVKVNQSRENSDSLANGQEEEKAHVRKREEGEKNEKSKEQEQEKGDEENKRREDQENKEEEKQNKRCEAEQENKEEKRKGNKRKAEQGEQAEENDEGQEKDDEEDESDKENTIPKPKTPLKTFENNNSNLENSSNLNNGNENHQENDQTQENSLPRRRSSRDTVLADITDQHCERVKTTVARNLFKPPNESRITRGMKRERKSPIITRKIRRTDQKTIMECFGKINAQNVSLNAENLIKTTRRSAISANDDRELEDECNSSKTQANCNETLDENDKNIEDINGSMVFTPFSKTENSESDQNEKFSSLEQTKTDENRQVIDGKNTKKPAEQHKKIEDNVFTKIKNRKKEISLKLSDDKNDNKLEEVTTNKRRSSAYGKISDLISDEQKKTIEKFYKVDMSVIDEDVIKSNYYINDKKQVICMVCNAIYPRIDKCQVHIRGHLDMKPYRCTACEFATVTVTNIRCHIRKKHLKIKPFACTVCSKKFVTAVLLEEHINSHTGARPYGCKVCDFRCASRQVLAYHNTTHKEVKDVECDICKKRFVSKGRLRAHIMTHNADKSLMCKYCSHHFTTSESLERHYKNVHSSDYICNVCGKRTKSRKALNNHQNVHSEAKYKCPMCPCVYKNSYILKEHLLKHEGIRKYKCDVCGKDFAQQSHLAAHKAVHSEKRYFCPGCNRAFNRHDNMKMHTKKCDSFLANPDLKKLLTRRSNSHIEIKNVNGVNNNNNNPDDINNSKVEDNKRMKTDDIKKTVTKNASFRIGDVDVVSVSDVTNVLVQNTKVTVTRTTAK